MVCIYCGNDTRVVNSRLQKKSSSVWRRRLCVKCTSVFTTIEVFQDNNSLMISDDNQRIAPFIREKFFLSIYDSCRHRQSAVTDARYLTNTIVSKMISKHEGATIQSTKLKETALKTLSRFDKVAATYYRAYFIN